MTDTLTAWGRLRYTKNKRSATYINGNPFVAFDPTGTFPIGRPQLRADRHGPGRKDRPRDQRADSRAWAATEDQ
jgi:hypothetical protein